MKHILLLCAACLTSGLLHAQRLQGHFEGSLQTPQGDLPILFHFGQHGDTPTNTMDSPAQGAYGIPVQRVHYGSDGKLTIEMPQIRFRYDGTLHFSTSFRGGGVNFTAKNATYFNHGTKTTKKVDFAVPLEPGKWHTCSIDVLEKEMKLAVDGKPLLTQAIPKDRGAVNFGVHQALDLDDLFVVAVE